jgi:hypothetical protein
MTDNGLVRFFRLGARDADARVAAFRDHSGAPATDRFIATSAIVTGLDVCFRRLETWWRASTAAEVAATATAAWSRTSGRKRHQAWGLFVLVAAGSHVAVTIAQGARPGWFWLVIPGMAAAFGLVLVAASRSAKSPN